MLDLKSNITVSRVISPVSVSDNTAQVGQVIDLANMKSCTFAIIAGSLADADAVFTVLLEESDAIGSGFAAVDDADLIGTELAAAPLFSDDDTVKTLGYKGVKRYVRLTITPSANSSAALLSAVAILAKKVCT